MGQASFWIFLAAASVALFSFLAVVVWIGTRQQERKDYYRFEFRKRMIDAGKMDGEAFATLMRYEHELSQQRARQKLLTAAFILVGVGAGLCAGFSLLGGPAWMLGFIPMSIGASMLVYGFLVAPKPTPGPVPSSWSSSTGSDH